MTDGDAHGLAREEVHNRFGMSAIDCQQQREYGERLASHLKDSIMGGASSRWEGSLTKENAMTRKYPRPAVSRRGFLAGVAVAGAATAAAPPQNSVEAATTAEATTTDVRRPSALRPSAHVAAVETGMPPTLSHAQAPDGSDFMVDVIKTLNINYLPANPASSFRGLHESLINYGKNTKPEFLTCMHEESAVALAHGYFKIAGKPLLTLCHGTVGLQHASMAVYNAWCDRVPVVIVGGNDLDAARRPPGVPTFHSAQDINALVRDFTKWDDTPVSLQHFAQSFVRAYKIAMTPPYGPVAISLDAGLQQEQIHENRERLYIPRYVPTSPPPGMPVPSARQHACLRTRNAPSLSPIAQHALRMASGSCVELAETLQAPVVDQRGRMNFPNTHHLQPSCERDRSGGRYHRAGALRLLGDRERLDR